MFFAGNAIAGIYAGTAAFMVATVISLAVARFRYHKIPVMPLVSGVIVLVFGGLTLYLHDDTFIKLKPTIVYSMFALLLLAGLLLRKPVLELLFGPVFTLTEEGWRKLTLRWTAVLRRHGDRQRAGVAQFLDRCLGQLQGVRLPAAHLPVRARPDAAAAAPWRAAAANRAIPKRKSEPKPSLNVIPLVQTANTCKGICAYRHCKGTGSYRYRGCQRIGRPSATSRLRFASSGLYKEGASALERQGLALGRYTFYAKWNV